MMNSAMKFTKNMDVSKQSLMAAKCIFTTNAGNK